MKEEIRAGRRGARVAVALIAAVVALGAAPMASALVPTDPTRDMTGIAQDDCGPQKPYASAASPFVCAYVTSRVARFFGPGKLLAVWYEVASYQTLDGGRVGPYSNDVGTKVSYDDAARARWNITGSGVNAHGVTTVKVEDAHDRELSVGVSANLKHFQSDAPGGLSLTCPAETYLVCRTAKVWEMQRGGLIENPPEYVIGFATIETRPLIVKILNLTDQPLVRRGDANGDGVVRQVGARAGVNEYATVPAAADGRIGVAYYQYFRDVSRADSVNLSFTFGDGATSTAYTGSLIDASILVAEDGSTDGSSCSAPTGGLVNLECKVTILGDHDGILTAVVAVTD